MECESEVGAHGIVNKQVHTGIDCLTNEGERPHYEEHVIVHASNDESGLEGHGAETDHPWRETDDEDHSYQHHHSHQLPVSS